jgi:hypothetical protein
MERRCRHRGPLQVAHVELIRVFCHSSLEECGGPRKRRRRRRRRRRRKGSKK